jgi:hypothetical protein
MEAVKTMIHDQDLPVHVWAEETRTTIYVQNKLPIMHLDSKLLKNFSPERIQK